MSDQKSKIVLTGATGFIGTYFFQEYSSVYDIQKVSLRYKMPTSEQFKDVKTVVHLAALVHQMKGAPESEYFKINHEYTLKLAQLAKSNGVKQFVFLSTSHVYGSTGELDNHNPCLTEDSPCSPISPYGKSKLAAEQSILQLMDSSFSVIIIRSPMVYGKGAKGNFLSLKKLINIMPILPFRYPHNRRSLIYVKNLTYFTHCAIQTNACGILLAQDKEPVSIQTIIEYIAKSSSRKVYLLPLPNLVIRILYKIFPHLTVRLFGSLAFDSQISNLKTSFIPKFSTIQGFKETFQED